MDGGEWMIDNSTGDDQHCGYPVPSCKGTKNTRQLRLDHGSGGLKKEPWEHNKSFSCLFKF